MPIFYGKSPDGSDAKEFEGFHISSCGNYWGSQPFTQKHEKELKRMDWKKRVNKLRGLH